jgi:hypothetical protein
MTVERRQVLPDLFKVDKSVDRPEQVVAGDMPLQRELIEQRSLFDLPMSHHDLQSCQLDRLNHRYLCVATAAFFNRIGQTRNNSLRTERVCSTPPADMEADPEGSPHRAKNGLSLALRLTVTKAQRTMDREVVNPC